MPLRGSGPMRRSRALAPTCCIFFCEALTERLPFENMSP